MLAGTGVASAATVENDLNLRAGPGTNYPVVGTMPAGAHVNVRDCNGSWCRVSFQGETGWASASYLGGGGERSTTVYRTRAYAEPSYGYVEPGYAYGPVTTMTEPTLIRRASASALAEAAGGAMGGTTAGGAPRLALIGRRKLKKPRGKPRGFFAARQPNTRLKIVSTCLK